MRMLPSMLTSTQSNLLHRLTENFGQPAEWKSKTGTNCSLWTTNLPFEIISPQEGGNDVHIRRTLENRRHLRTVPVVLIADSDDPTKSRVVGPHEPYIVRKLNTTSVLNLIGQARQLNTRPAAAFLEREFRRLDESVLPGIRVKELLTPHYIRTRLRQHSSNKEYLETATQNIKRITQTTTWRTLFGQLGFQIDRLEPRGYLLRYQDSPVAVVHPMNSAEEFIRMNENGEIPDGLVLKDCQNTGAHWGILVAGLRFRIFQANPNFGSATARYIEIDARELDPQDRLYLGLLAPESLVANGRLTSWASDARDFGEELRKGLEERLRTNALPNLAKGVGRYLELTQGVNLKDREKLQEIEEAVLTLVFRFMFLLHVEARGYLPMNSDDYTSKSARRIAEESRKEQWEYDSNSTRLWDSLRTLTRMIRHGDQQIGVPAYNGSLFASDKFPGAELLENIEIPDTYFAPAIRSITFDPDQSDAGLDYAGLQVGHLGAIYEALLALKLTRANEDLKYDTKRDVFRPMRSGEKSDITASDLFYQTEKGGRKAGGVYYTREEFVQHLLKNSLIPALGEHLERVKALANTDPAKAATVLFDFSIVDPAMGSGHFLTTALDIMADRIELFLADIGGLPAVRDQLNNLRKGEDKDLATIEDVDLLRRLILKRCIYGVDISPMAVEVANVTLWLASFVPGLALSYLGSNLKCGDALIGVADPSIVGSSDSPFFTGQAVTAAMESAAQLHRKLGSISDITPAEVKRSQELDDEMYVATGYLRSAFNLWVADPLGLEGARHILEMHATGILKGDLEGPYWEAYDTLEAANFDAVEHRFFHWPIEFPHIFHRGNPGFDVVVGNPPWNKVKFEKPAFIALHDPGYLGLKSTADRDDRETVLMANQPHLKGEIERLKESIELQRRFFKPENGYSDTGRGDTDLYKLFCKRYSTLGKYEGYIGVVLPRGVLINDGSSPFRNWFFTACSPDRIDVILNNKQWAFPIHPQTTIALVVAQIGCNENNWLKLSGPSRDLEDFYVSVSENEIAIEFDDLRMWSTGRSGSKNHATWEVPLIRNRMQADILTKMQRGKRFDELRYIDLKSETNNNANISRMAPYIDLHSKSQRPLFNHPKADGRIPVWRGQSFDQYSPHGDKPAGYADIDAVTKFLEKKILRSNVFTDLMWQDLHARQATHPIDCARVSFRDVTNRTNSRTVIACLIPPQIPLSDSAPYLISGGWQELDQSAVLGILNTLAYDWLARRYVEQHFKYYILDMLPFPAPNNTPWQQIGKLAARLSCVDERFADFAAEAGVEYGPQTDAERDDMRAEIDALVARAYELTEDELCFVFTDFTERAVTAAYRRLVLEKFEVL